MEQRAERAAENDREAAVSRLSVSRETLDRLDVYAGLLRRWQPIKNLVAPSTLDHLWTRHILDSAQIDPLAEGATSAVDLGSGAGFPGLVLAILWTGRPGALVHLVESNARKAAFLQEVARSTGAAARIHAARIERVVPSLPGIELVTARALAPLTDLLGWSEPLLKSGARAVFLKGREAGQDLLEAGKSWRLDTQLIPSVTDSQGCIVHVRRAERLGSADA